VLAFFSVDSIIVPALQTEIHDRLRQSGLEIALHYQTRANLTREQIRLLSDMGTTSIVAGVESLSTKLLRRMKKGTTALQNVQMLKWCEEEGITVSWNLMYGVPGEETSDYEPIKNWIGKLTHLRPPVSFRRMEPHRFSPYHFDASALQVSLRPLPDYRFLYPKGRLDLSRAAYYFEPPDPDPAVFSYFKAIHLAVDLWTQRYFSPRLPKLVCWPGPGFVQLIDGRRLADSRTLNLHGVIGDLYLHCDRIRSRQEIASFVRSRLQGEVREEPIDGVLQLLLDEGVMLAENNHFLSLATRMKPEFSTQRDYYRPACHVYPSDFFDGQAPQIQAYTATPDFFKQEEAPRRASPAVQETEG
jgi:hypothetical protein